MRRHFTPTSVALALVAILSLTGPTTLPAADGVASPYDPRLIVRHSDPSPSRVCGRLFGAATTWSGDFVADRKSGSRLPRGRRKASLCALLPRLSHARQTRTAAGHPRQRRGILLPGSPPGPGAVLGYDLPVGVESSSKYGYYTGASQDETATPALGWPFRRQLRNAPVRCPRGPDRSDSKRPMSGTRLTRGAGGGPTPTGGR